MFITTLWYDNVDNYDFLSWKMFFHWKFTWCKCFFNHLKKVKWSFEFLQNGKMLSNMGFKKTFIKLLVYIYTNVQLCLNFIFIILVTSFDFEVKSFICDLKKIQNEYNLMCPTFGIICSPKFPSNCVHCSVHSSYISSHWQTLK